MFKGIVFWVREIMIGMCYDFFEIWLYVLDGVVRFIGWERVNELGWNYDG